MAAIPLLRRAEPNLDFLRAFAVIAVLVAHTFDVLAGPGALLFGMHPWELGRIGVSLFFVHTSLVLFGSLSRSEARGRVSFKDFYIRRAFRIYPLSMVCVLAVVLLELPASPTDPAFLPRGAGTIAANLILMQDLFNADSVIGALWSLPVEVQMYVVLPFLYLLGRWARLHRRDLVLVLGLTTLAPIVALLPVRGLYRLSVLEWAPCFGAGFLAWAGMGRTERRLPGWLWPVAMMGSFLLFLPMGMPEYKHPARSWLMCMMVGLLLPYFGDLRSQLVVTPAKLIARYSYGIYLVHQAWLTIAFIWLAHWSFVPKWMVFVLGVGLTSWGGYHFIEEPGIRLGRLVAQRVTAGPIRHAGQPG